ncbi:MAG: hypothetical protein PHU85_00385 [Phycisphaerae bacterium]|nr:hypothetical protein [Phycisphaerae bacterium]
MARLPRSLAAALSAFFDSAPGLWGTTGSSAALAAGPARQLFVPDKGQTGPGVAALVAWVKTGTGTAEYAGASPREALALLAARTDTAWFAALAGWPRVYIRGRIAFAGYTEGAPSGSMLVYHGPRVAQFAKTFGTWGVVEGMPTRTAVGLAPPTCRREQPSAWHPLPGSVWGRCKHLAGQIRKFFALGRDIF